VTTSARSLFLALSVFAAVGAGGAGPEGPAVKLTVRTPGGLDRPATFEASGLDRATLDAMASDPARMSATWAVFTVDDPGDDAKGPRDRPALLGSYEVDREAGVLRFRTRFPLEPGVHYRAVFRRPGTVASLSYTRPKPPAGKPTTRVVRVSPARGTLPENLLKFYIEFSAPMSRGEAYEHVRLLDASGKPLDLPFLELGEELWDPRGVRFTLLFDPGRIKTGLKPREELGPVLEAGKSYTLVIDRGWHDAAGKPLADEFRKPFRAGPADTTPVDPKSWALDVPAAGTRAPLKVTFPEPLDRALLGRVVGVAVAGGKGVAGAVVVGDDETSWSFTPDEPWTAGRFVLRADRALEDLAGNSIGRPFEVDVFKKVELQPASETVEVPFVIGPAR
jgi:hypothetical protein